MRHKRKPHKRQATGISIHAPLAGCDGLQEKQRGTHLKFQSTHPLRGATASPKSAHIRHLHFNPHFNPRTPCGVRPRGILRDAAIPDISIHAPLAGCDDGICAAQEVGKDFNPRTPCGVRRRSNSNACRTERFQSAHPLRGATIMQGVECLRRKISIRAPLAGCDSSMPCNPSTTASFQSAHPLRGATLAFAPQALSAPYFNPRTPCGVRRVAEGDGRCLQRFQSTHPLRGATSALAEFDPVIVFQSTHPLRGATGYTGALVPSMPYFNPRTPCGVRRPPKRGH